MSWPQGRNVPPLVAIMTLPKKFDTTLALKAIALTEKLTGSEKRLAGALLDHFNRTTGRCDPSYETLATILGINRRTVGRGVTKLVKINFFKMVRHGGNGNCNSYQPSWSLYRELEELWKRQRRQHAARFTFKEMSSLPGQTCPTAGGETDLQTYSTKFIPLTSSRTDLAKYRSQNRADTVASSEAVETEGGLGIFGPRIEKRLGSEIYGGWFRRVHFLEMLDQIIILSADDSQTKNRIEQWYGTDILRCFEPEHVNVVRIEVVIRKPGS